MEPLSDPTQETTTAASARQLNWSPHRTRLLAVITVLVAWSFLQSPGRIHADTKLGIILNPGHFMAKATTLWDADFFGQLQNQAYGYFFPMGPFFWVAHNLHMPPWAGIAAWNATLVCAAFVGVYLVARRLVDLGPNAAIFAGLAYALSPRMQTMIGPVSSEIMPMAALPWILLPLCAQTLRDRPTLGAVVSALAVSLAGGVNAVATLAVLIMPGLFLLTRARCKANAVRLCVWLAAVIVACFWWAGPLLLLGRYSPGFLDWIESSAITTGVTNAPNVLRGTNQWAAFISDGGGPTWPAGHFLAAMPLSICATMIVAGLGLVGLYRSTSPERKFLALCALVGFTCLSCGYVHSVNASVAEPIRSWLDQGGAPFRNVHKFDPLLRLPLTLGLACLWAQHWPRNWRKLTPKHSTHALALIATAAVAVPFIAGGTAARGGFTAVPDAWLDAGKYLNQYPTDRALVVPSSPFGDYTWGQPRDEPLQVTTRAAWAVRDVVPLSSAGNIRVLDAVDQVLAHGRADSSLAQVLAQLGVHRLVVRNDLAWKRNGLTRPEIVHATLSDSPGLEFEAGFGQARSVESEVVANLTAAARLYPVEIWRVHSTGHNDRRVSLHAGDTVLDGIASESVMATAKIPGLAAAVHARTPGSIPLVTDGNQRKEHYFPRTTQAYTPALPADVNYVENRAAHDYQTEQLKQAEQTTLRLQGATRVESSTSTADVNAYFTRDVSGHAHAAVDGDPNTRWLSGGTRGPVGQWWSIHFPNPLVLNTVKIRWATRQSDRDFHLTRPTQITVMTSTGSRSVHLDPRQVTSQLDVGKEKTTFLRVRIDSAASHNPQNYVGMSEVSLPQAVRAALTIPATQATSVKRGKKTANQRKTVIALKADTGSAPGCIALKSKPLCHSTIGHSGSESAGLFRDFHLANQSLPHVAAHVVATNPQALADRVYPGAQKVVTAVSSTSTNHPWASAAALLDNNRDTSWIPSTDDEAPHVTITLAKPSLVTELELLTRRDAKDAGNTAAALDVIPAQVTLSSDRGEQYDAVVREGKVKVTFERPVKNLTIAITGARVLSPKIQAPNSFGRPFHLSEIRVLATKKDITPRITSPTTVTIGCSEGLSLSIDGVKTKYGVTADVTSLLAGRTVPVSWCDRPPKQLTPGPHQVSAPRTFGLSMADLNWSAPLTTQADLEPGSQPSTSPGTNKEPTLLSIQSWNQTKRKVTLSGTSNQPQILRVSENFNDGWQARTEDGTELQAIVVDGWSQGWLVPANTRGTLTLEFAPATMYRALLITGGASCFLMFIASVVCVCRKTRPSKLQADTIGCRIDTQLVHALTACAGTVALAVSVSWIAAVLMWIGVGIWKLIGRPLAASDAIRRTLTIEVLVALTYTSVTVALTTGIVSPARPPLWTHLAIAIPTIAVLAAQCLGQSHSRTLDKHKEAVG